MIIQLEAAAVGRPITRAGVSFFPVYIHQPAVTLGAGGAGEMQITEHPGAVVPSLRIENHGPVPVLLVEGETVTGGNQNRVINVSVLVPARSGVDIPVSCVEQGRWGGGSDFSRSRTFATRRIRRAKQVGVSRSVREQGLKRSDQGAVWASVEHELDRLGVHSPTNRFDQADEVFERDQASAAAVELLVRRGPLPGQCGIAVSHGSRVVAADVFATPELLATRWEALVRGQLLDVPHGVRSSPSATNALRFLRRLGSATSDIVPGVGLGNEHHVSHRRLIGQALVWDDALVHASAFALAA